MPTRTTTAGVYGWPPARLAAAPAGAIQVSPRAPGAATLEDTADGALTDAVIAAPPGTLERRYVIAQALRALSPGGRLTVLAPKDRGGARLYKELTAFGCAVTEDARRHHRICACLRPQAPEGLEAAIAQGGPQIAPRLGLWSQPGVFSWDRLDPGTALLLEAAGDLVGRGADLGCGVGVLGRAVLGSPDVTDVALIDIDRRAVEAARRNIDDPRATFLQADITAAPDQPSDLDFVIMNPPFHEGGDEDKHLGQAFIRRAAVMLKAGGTCRLVANVALPYEGVLAEVFKRVRTIGHARGYKLLEALK